MEPGSATDNLSTGGNEGPLSEGDSTILERATECNTYKQNPAKYGVLSGGAQVIAGTGTTSVVTIENEQNSFTASYRKLSSDTWSYVYA